MIWPVQYHRHFTNCKVYAIILFLFLIEITKVELKEVKFGFTDEEKSLIPKFHKLVENSVPEDYNYMLHDSYLVRWIRSRNYNLEKATHKFQNHLQWKKEIKNSNIPIDSAYLHRLFPYKILQSKDGRPALIIKLGQWDIRKAMLTSKQRNPFVRHLSKMLDEVSLKIIEWSQNENGETNVTNGIDLIDINGYNLRVHSCAVCIPEFLYATEVWEGQYPRLFGDIVVINTPRIFQSLLDITISALGDYNKNILKVYGLNKSDWNGPVMDLIGGEGILHL